MYQRTVLDNQLRVITTSMPYTPSVSVVISVGAGSRYEPDQLAGISHFLEHLPFKGTKNWPTAREVSEAIEGVGGIMNASTDREMTVFWCKVAQLHFRQSMAVVLDMVLNPLLDPVEVEKEREVVQEELRMTNDYPSNRADLLIDEVLWPGQPMGRDVGGTPESVNGISLNSIREYMDRQYSPNNTVISVAGNVEHDEVVSIVEKSTRHWLPQPPLPWQPVVNGTHDPVVRVEQRRTDQSHLCLGLQGLSLTDPDRYAFALLNVVLGDGMSSRLFLSLREQQALAYEVHSSVSNFRDCGSLIVYCGVEPRKTRDAVHAVVQELKLMHEEISPRELSKAKEYTKGRLLLRMEDSQAVAAWMGNQELLLGRVDTAEDVVKGVEGVSEDDVVRVARRLLNEDQLRLAVVGPHRGGDSLRRLLRF
ncbi:MAG: insulinase family protein [Dehalococcoidia bacterium]|nr:insulinase family protein [Dehalococcoidia bacterium]MSQ17078.1 insulinase family protein [Dehalococcoidia bacterium]